MAVPAILVLGGMGLVALVAAVATGGKKEEAPPGTPPGTPPATPPQVPPRTAPPQAAPPQTDGNGMVVIPPIIPRPGDTDASILAWAQGMIDTATKALRNNPSKESVQAATAAAALLESNGFTEQATALRALARQVSSGLAVEPMTANTGFPADVQTKVDRALQLESSPRILRELATALRATPYSSNPNALSAIQLLEAKAAQLEAQQSKADTLAKIDEILAQKTPAPLPEPIPQDRWTPASLPAEVQALVDAATRALNIVAGVVKGPVTADGLSAARKAAEALALEHQDALAGQWQEYLRIATAMWDAQRSQPATPPAPPQPVSTGQATYKVLSGDNPSIIARKLTGDANRWRELVNYNCPPKVKASNGNFKTLYAGEVLKLPAGWSSTPV